MLVRRSFSLCGYERLVFDALIRLKNTPKFGRKFNAQTRKNKAAAKRKFRFNLAKPQKSIRRPVNPRPIEHEKGGAKRLNLRAPIQAYLNLDRLNLMPRNASC